MYKRSLFSVSCDICFLYFFMMIAILSDVRCYLIVVLICNSMIITDVGHLFCCWLVTTLWRRKWQSTPVFLPGESQGWGSLVAAVYGVTQSQTRLKWLSSSNSSFYVVSDSVTPWTIAHQVPLWMGFPGKNNGVGFHFLLQGIVPTLGLSSSFPFKVLLSP